ncbi:type IV secretory system conjugative DNA transfer family protein, partial [Magnetospirillum moscoviense]|uniref:type IV secretory system conjugative DNA transfer family protein n=1 Tax=Magnetospirillum moscoviense TaxID=1437059 RepID=UPI000B004FFB
EGSIRFNPLAEVRIGTGHEVADAQNIAAMIIDPDGKGLADFWAKSGFAWLTAAILYTLYTVRRDQGRIAGLPDVDAVLTAPGEGLDELLSSMVAFADGTEAANRLVNSAAQEMQDRAAQERSGVQSSSKVDLSLYRDPIIARNIATSDFRLDDLMNGDKPASLYLIVPPSDIDRLRPLLRVILNLFMRRLMQNVGADGKATNRHRLLLMLDEFTSVGKLEIFERALAFMAGYGIKAFLIVQDLVQLQGTYGRENSIVGNCHKPFRPSGRCAVISPRLSCHFTTGEKPTITDKDRQTSTKIDKRRKGTRPRPLSLYTGPATGITVRHEAHTPTEARRNLRPLFQ